MHAALDNHMDKNIVTKINPKCNLKTKENKTLLYGAFKADESVTKLNLKTANKECFGIQIRGKITQVWDEKVF